MGGRPAKAAAVSDGKIGKAARAQRQDTEARLRGTADKLTPPDWLSEDQKSIFQYVVDELEPSAILGNLDVFVLAQLAVAVDRITAIEKQINDDPINLYDKGLMTANRKYTEDLRGCCRELSLSPQARAKIGGLALAKREKEEDPVLTVLKGGKKGKTSSA